MNGKHAWIGFMLGMALAVLSPPGSAVGSDPLPVPTGTPRERAVSEYNDGVRLMLEKRYPAAQQKFEEALALDERLAEAHNNLAFSLRMQKSLPAAARATMPMD